MISTLGWFHPDLISLQRRRTDYITLDALTVEIPRSIRIKLEDIFIS
mgnify:CR=1 FL=1